MRRMKIQPRVFRRQKLIGTGDQCRSRIPAGRRTLSSRPE
jgi:hypothetical protein